jgi:hypothetical protein
MSERYPRAVICGSHHFRLLSGALLSKGMFLVVCMVLLIEPFPFSQGKFYELYEKDAEIGHNEFDLKLTDRVKMKMVSLILPCGGGDCLKLFMQVGVPEQSFDYWCAKFLAAGYKVGKVEQAETAIG